MTRATDWQRESLQDRETDLQARESYSDVCGRKLPVRLAQEAKIACVISLPGEFCVCGLCRRPAGTILPLSKILFDKLCVFLKARAFLPERRHDFAKNAGRYAGRRPRPKPPARPATLDLPASVGVPAGPLRRTPPPCPGRLPMQIEKPAAQRAAAG